MLQMMLVALGGKKHLQNLVRGFTGEAFNGLPADARAFLLHTTRIASS